jgi:hypothetical protein
VNIIRTVCFSLFLCGSARAGSAEQSAVQQADPALVQKAQRDAEAKDPRVYSDVPQWAVDAAGGLEFGMGAAVPSLHAPAYVMHVKLGASIHTPGNFAFVIAGQSGINMSFNGGSGSPQYGYIVRIPLDVTVDVIHSLILSDRKKWYLNIHFGGLAGGDFLLAAQCQTGECKYIQPTSTAAFGPRIGVSWSAARRSSYGAFVTWHNNVADCKVAGNGACFYWLSTVVFTLGWTLF